jgi:hypothetical protein
MLLKLFAFLGDVDIYFSGTAGVPYGFPTTHTTFLHRRFQTTTFH